MPLPTGASETDQAGPRFHKVEPRNRVLSAVDPDTQEVARYRLIQQLVELHGWYRGFAWRAQPYHRTSVCEPYDGSCRLAVETNLHPHLTDDRGNVARLDDHVGLSRVRVRVSRIGAV